MRELQECKLKGFLLKESESLQKKCFRLLVPYCCDFPEGKDMSDMQRGVAVKKACVGCVVTRDDIISSRMATERSVKDTIMVRWRCITTL